MSDDQFKPTGSPALDRALDLVAEMEARDWAYVPRQPTSRMIEVGAAVGGVGPTVAERIYIAMLRMV
jgi:hypothetical protein